MDYNLGNGRLNNNMKGNIEETKDSKIIVKVINESFLTVANEFGYTVENAATFPAFIGMEIIEKQLIKEIKIEIQEFKHLPF